MPQQNCHCPNAPMPDFPPSPAHGNSNLFYRYMDAYSCGHAVVSAKILHQLATHVTAHPRFRIQIPLRHLLRHPGLRQLDEDWIQEVVSQTRGGWGQRLASIVNTDCPSFALSVLVRPHAPEIGPWTAQKTASFQRYLSSYRFYVISGGHRLEVMRRAIKADLRFRGDPEPSDRSILDHPNAVWVCNLFSHGKLP